MIVIISPNSTFPMKAISTPSYSKCRISTTNLHNASYPNPSTQLLPMLQNPPKPKPSLSPQEIHTKSIHPMKKKNGNTNADPADILRLMDGLRLSIPQDVYAYLIKECTDLRNADSGAKVHSHMNQCGYLPTLLLANRLLHMYVCCGCLNSAHQLFDKMIVKDSVSWVIMIIGHVENGDYIEALTLFKQMYQQQHELLKKSTRGLVVDCVLRACVGTGDIGLGKQVHGLVLKMQNKGDCDLFVGSLFINFYGKLGCIRSARRIFDKMEKRDTVIWTAMIVVYSKEVHFEEVLELFKMMGRAGARKNNFTLSSVIRACGRMGDEGSGRQVHGNAIKLGVESDQFVQCSLVDMYGKCGMVNDARKVFEMTSNLGFKKRRNDVCWNAMLTAYMQNGFCDEAIKFLYQMKSNGVQPPESLLDQVRIECGK